MESFLNSNDEGSLFQQLLSDCGPAIEALLSDETDIRDYDAERNLQLAESMTITG
jgi:hypothetical protein